MKGLLVRAADVLGPRAYLAWRNRARLPILMYHGVTERPLTPFCWHMLELARLRAQLEHVARRYTVLPLGPALAQLAEGRLPPRSAAITFDDGYLSNRTLALPLLQRLGLPATVFVVTGMLGTSSALWPDLLYLACARARATRIDLGALGLGTRPLADDAERARAYALAVHALKALPVAEKDAHLARLVDALDPSDLDDPGAFRLMSWDDVRALAGTGLVSIGAHSTQHEILSRQDDASVALAVRASQDRVTREVGVAPAVFAYPNGRASDFDARAQASVTAAGMRFALSTTPGLADRRSPPLALPRLCIGADLSLPRFRLLLAGA